MSGRLGNPDAALGLLQLDAISSGDDTNKVASDHGNGNDTAVLTASIVAMEFGLGIESYIAPWYITETGTGAEVAIPGMFAQEFGTGQELDYECCGPEVGPEADAAIYCFEGGAGDDEGVPPNNAAVAAESGTGIEAPVETSAPTSPEAGTGTEAAFGGPAIGETGSGVDSPVQAGSFAAAEIGHGVDCLWGGPQGSEAGTGSDSGHPAASMAASDAGGLTAESPALSLLQTEVGNGVEGITIINGPSFGGTAIGSDAGTVAAIIPASDSGTGTDSPSAAMSILAADIGNGSESAGENSLLFAVESGTANIHCWAGV